MDSNDSQSNNNNSDDGSINIKFRLSSSLVKWNKNNCKGFKVYNEQRDCKYKNNNESNHEINNAHYKHIIISNGAQKGQMLQININWEH